MAVFEHRFRVEAPVEAVARFHAGPSVLQVLTPPPVRVELHRFGDLEEGMEAEFTLWIGPLPIRWKARHEDVGPTGFVDVQVEGPMASWRHTHRFEALGREATEVVDRIEYAHPRGLAGVGTRAMFNRASLEGVFFYRALATRRSLAEG